MHGRHVLLAGFVAQTACRARRADHRRDPAAPERPLRETVAWRSHSRPCSCRSRSKRALRAGWPTGSRASSSRCCQWCWTETGAPSSSTTSCSGRTRTCSPACTPMAGAFKRVVAGMPSFMTETQSPREIAFPRDDPGHMVSLDLPTGHSICVREHQSLAATGASSHGGDRGIDDTFTCVRGIGNMPFGGTGLIIDRFQAGGEEDLAWLHSHGNVAEKVLAPASRSRSRSRVARGCTAMARCRCSPPSTDRRRGSSAGRASWCSTGSPGRAGRGGDPVGVRAPADRRLTPDDRGRQPTGRRAAWPRGHRRPADRPPRSLAEGTTAGQPTGRRAAWPRGHRRPADWPSLRPRTPADWPPRSLAEETPHASRPAVTQPGRADDRGPQPTGHLGRPLSRLRPLPPPRATAGSAAPRAGSPARPRPAPGPPHRGGRASAARRGAPSRAPAR